jgi:4-amino-4-deoxy-L-arabinose transferase-like glycosyltransferase
LLLLMMLLQLAWLAGIVWAGVESAVAKIPAMMVYTLVCGLGLMFLPARGVDWVQRGEEWLVAHPRWALWGVLLLVLLVGGVYATQQRLWAFDEEGSWRAARVVAERGVRQLFVNYGERFWLGGQHPPLSPIVRGGVMALLGSSLWVARWVNVLATAVTVGLVYALGWQLGNGRVALYAALSYVAFPLVLRLGTTAMVEPLLVLLFTAVCMMALQVARRSAWIDWLLLAVLLLLGMLTKYTMILALPIVLGILLGGRSWRQMGRLLLAAAGLGLLLAVAVAVLVTESAVLRQQAAAIWHYAGMVLTNEYGRQLLLETVSNRLPSSLGVYNVPLLAVGGILAVWQRGRMNGVLLLWVTAVWLLLLLTLPDHRYFLSSFPALAVLMARALAGLPAGAGRILLLALLYCGGSLYIFVDWMRTGQLFLP